MADQGAPTGKNDGPRRFVREHDLVALKTNVPGAIERLEQKLSGYARLFSSSLSAQDLEDVISEAKLAFFEAIEHIEDPENPSNGDVEGLNDIIRRTIERHRKRAQRLLPRSQSEPSPETPGPREIDQIEAKDRVNALVVHLIPLMERSLALQTEKDHDLIVRHYRLDKIGLEAQAEEIDFQTAAARKKAIQRARQRFGRTLESQLLGAELMKDILADALRIVQGETFLQMFEASEEIDDD